MLRNSFGQHVLELDDRLGRITGPNPIVSEADFFEAIKCYALNEALIELGTLSNKVFNESFPADWAKLGKRGGVRHPAGIFITQFAIEYIAAAFLLSRSESWKSESIKRKDNLLGLFNIYNNSLITNTSIKSGLAEILVPMYFQQFVSQRDPVQVFTRQWYIFSKIRSRTKHTSLLDIDVTFTENTGLTCKEFLKIALIFYAYIIVRPRFNIGDLSGDKHVGMRDVLNADKFSAFLNLMGATNKQFKDIDKELNKNLDSNFTKTRFNPLWVKPIVRLGENDFLAPSITAFMTATFNGIFWWFDTFFRRESRKKGDAFRDYFGHLFEEYVGDVLKDVYQANEVTPGIKYGNKKSGGYFFDWIVTLDNKVLLFESKANQFPLNVLQKGDSGEITRELTNKVVKTILQMYARIKSVPNIPELSHLSGKRMIPIAVFYDIPFITTPLYKNEIQRILKGLEVSHPGISAFEFYFLGIDELEIYCKCSDGIELDDLLRVANNDGTTGFATEVAKNASRTKRKTLLEQTFDEFTSELLKKS